MKTELEFKSEALSTFLTHGFTIAGDIVTPVDASEEVPSKLDWDAKIAELKAEYATQEYARNRLVGKGKTFKEITTTVTDDQGDETEVKSIVPDKEAINGYPDIGDQLDDLYHAGVFSADMTAKLKKVKDDFPKPT
jgi:hypothetical protein